MLEIYIAERSRKSLSLKVYGKATLWLGTSRKKCCITPVHNLVRSFSSSALALKCMFQMRFRNHQSVWKHPQRLYVLFDKDDQVDLIILHFLILNGRFKLLENEFVGK